MIAIPVFAEQFVNKIRGPVDNQMLVGEIGRGIDAAEQFNASQPVDLPVGLMNGAQDLLAAVPRRGIPFLYTETFAEDSFQVTDVARGDELTAASNAEIQVTGLLGREIDSEGDGFFLG